MLYKSKLFTLETIVYSWYKFDGYWFMGPSGHFYSYIYISHDVDWDRFCIWVKLPIQRRLCSIFVNNVGVPGIHEDSAG